MNKNNKVRRILSICIASILLTGAFGGAVITHESEETEAVAPLLVAGIFLLGFGAGVLAEHYKEMSDPNPGDMQEAVNGALRQGEAEKVTWYADGVTAFAGTLLPSDTSLWGFTRDHWDRSAELAVASEWQLGRSYNPNYILEDSMMRKNLEAYTYNWQAALDNAYTHSVIKQINKWDSEEYLQAVTADLVWDGGSAQLRDSIIDFCTLVENVSNGSTIYIDSSQLTTGGTYHQNTSGVIYNLKSVNVTIREVLTGKTITLIPGINDLSATYYNGTAVPMESGLYRIETDGASLAGPITKAADANAADVVGTMVHSTLSEIRWFTYHSGSTWMNYQTSSVQTDKLSIDITYVDKDGEEKTAQTWIVNSAADGPSDLPRKTIEDWNELIQKFNYTINTASTAGEVLWNIFDICEESIPVLAPSSLTVSIQDVILSSWEATATYLQGLMDLARVYELYGDKISSFVQSYTPESLGLYVRADIYYNNSLMYKDAVFTPYSTLQEQTLQVGQITHWNNAGFAMYWGTSPDISDWDGPTNTSEHRLLTLNSGYTIDVKQIGRNGKMISSVSLVPEEIKKYTVDPAEPPGPVSPPKFGSNAVDWVAIALLVIGAIMIMLGIAIRNTPLFVIGLILITAGAWMIFKPDIWGMLGFPRLWIGGA